MDPPSNLPSAIKIGRTLLEYCAPQEEVNSLLALETLRYELLVEQVKRQFDHNLEFMNYFDIVRNPNAIHIFLANNILNGNYVATTNFDYLIEYAMKQIVKREEHQNIIPVITKDDFLAYSNPHELIELRNYPLYKLHGSKSNIITEKNTIDSLITTISALGKDRAEGETFAIEEFKKPTVDHLMRNRILIVMGYSGSDDFDIGPVLKRLTNLKQLIWVEHAHELTEVEQFAISTITNMENIQNLKNLSRTDRLLNEIRFNSNFDVIKIKAHTREFIKKILWESIIPNTQIIEPVDQSNEDLTLITASNFSLMFVPAEGVLVASLSYTYKETFLSP